VSIHNSSAGIFYYYYFYDWEIEQESRACPGPRTSVEAHVKICTGIEDFWSGSLRAESFTPKESRREPELSSTLLKPQI
jgi:hypothetical protein